MPVQVRNLNLNLLKWTQSRITSYVTYLDHKNNNNTIDKGQTTALSIRTDDHFGQLAPASQPFTELLNCNTIQTQIVTQPKTDSNPLLDPCWSQGSLSTPSLPIPPVLNPQPLRSSSAYTSLHIQDCNSSFAKLVNSTSQNVITTKDIESVTDFSLAPLRDETTCTFPLWVEKPGIAADPVMEALDAAYTKTQPICSTWSYSDSGPKSQSLIYSCEEPKSSELSCSSSPESKSSPPEDKGKGPSEQQLLEVKNKLVEVVPYFFKKPHNYRMYHPELVFINNFWGKESISKGLPLYMVELSKARIYSHVKYAQCQMSIINVTIHPKEGCIKLHWRVSGLPQLKTLQFWKFLPWTYRKSLQTESKFFDGISTVFIGSDELIHKHRIDRLMPDEESMPEKIPALSLKLGLLFGILPRTT